MDEIIKAKIAILQELISKKKIGGSHIPLDKVLSHAPSEFLHDKKGKKILESALKELANDYWITVLIKKTGKGTGNHISINPRSIKDVCAFLEKTNNL
ncbi:hypothetical protein HZA97_00270 [Candidatus Woesearchaeota archaeon]|nr:hypothetical protein [Candidatus Woesearchaeota archaeon]